MKIVFEENFATTLEGGWDWVHEEPAAWRVSDGALLLRTLPGSLWDDANNAHNFLLRPAELLDGLIIRVAVKSFPLLMGEQAGLIWYHDDDNYIKLVKESLNDEEWIVLAREEAGKPALINKTGLLSETAQLQFVFSGDNVQGQFRISPRDDWETVGECALVKKSAPKVGLFTHGGPDDIERWVELRSFSIRKME